MDDDLSLAIQRIQRGQKEDARSLIEAIIRANPRNADAWLWLSEVVDDDKQRRWCLDNVLQVDPDNEIASRGLVLLARRPTWVSGGAIRPQSGSLGTLPAPNMEPHRREPTARPPLLADLGEAAHSQRLGPSAEPSTKNAPPTPALLLVFGICVLGLALLGRCTNSEEDNTADAAGQAAIEAVQRTHTAIADNMHDSIGFALAYTEAGGHSVSIDGWYVRSAADHHEVLFRFLLDGDLVSAEWWYYPDGRVVPRNTWALAFMGQ